MSQTDLMTMARFLVLPGASELLEAFARIPPGKLRDSAVLHVQAIAETYAAAPAAQHMPDPLLMAAQASPPVASVTNLEKQDRRLKSKDPNVKATELLLDGHAPHKVAEELGMSVGDVMDAKRTARQAGVNFPPGTAKRTATGFALKIEDFESRGLAMAAKAAKRRDLDLDDYIGRRRMAVEMAQAGRHIRAIMDATKEDEKSIRGWLNSARSGGHVIPYLPFDNAAKAAEPTAKIIDLKPHRREGDPYKGRFVLHSKDLDDATRGSVMRGAALMDLTVDEYLRRRREALKMFTDKRTCVQVAKALNISERQAVNWRSRAQRAGLLDLVRPSTGSFWSRNHGQGPVKIAAEAMGVTVEEYSKLRDEALDLFNQGLTAPEVAAVVGVTVKKASNWWTSTQARAQA